MGLCRVLGRGRTGAARVQGQASTLRPCAHLSLNPLPPCPPPPPRQALQGPPRLPARGVRRLHHRRAAHQGRRGGHLQPQGLGRQASGRQLAGGGRVVVAACCACLRVGFAGRGVRMYACKHSQPTTNTPPPPYTHTQGAHASARRLGGPAGVAEHQRRQPHLRADARHGAQLLLGEAPSHTGRRVSGPKVHAVHARHGAGPHTRAAGGGQHRAAPAGRACGQGGVRVVWAGGRACVQATSKRAGRDASPLSPCAPQMKESTDELKHKLADARKRLEAARGVDDLRADLRRHCEASERGVGARGGGGYGPHTAAIEPCVAVCVCSCCSVALPHTPPPPPPHPHTHTLHPERACPPLPPLLTCRSLHGRSYCRWRMRCSSTRACWRYGLQGWSDKAEGRARVTHASPASSLAWLQGMPSRHGAPATHQPCCRPPPPTRRSCCLPTSPRQKQRCSA